MARAGIDAAMGANGGFSGIGIIVVVAIVMTTIAAAVATGIVIATNTPWHRDQTGCPAVGHLSPAVSSEIDCLSGSEHALPNRCHRMRRQQK
jgi:hypothetical protein